MELQALVRRLRGSRDWRDVIARVTRLVADDPARALALADALDTDVSVHGPDLAVSSVRGQLLDIVVTVPSAHATRVVVALAARPAPQRFPQMVESVRAGAATRIVGTRPAREINALLQTDIHQDDPEFGLLLVHELAICGALRSDVADHYVAWAESTSHPLRHLPVRLTPVEKGLRHWLPRYRQPHHPGMAASFVSTVSYQTPRRSSPFPLGSLCPGIGAAIDVDEAMIAATVGDWAKLSNGQLTIRGRRPGADFSGELPAAPPRLRSDVPAHRIAVAETCELLFSAAVGGGAYTRGCGGPHSRLRMWQTICGMLGTPWPAPIDELCTHASTATWIQLDPVDDWFHTIAWDVWLLMATDIRVVMLAATDQD